MISQKTVINFKVGDRSYDFHCDPQSPLGEIHDALCEMKKYVVERIMEIHAAEQKAKEQPKEG